MWVDFYGNPVRFPDFIPLTCIALAALVLIAFIVAAIVVDLRELHRKWNARNEARLQKRKAGNANEPHRKSHSLR